MNDSQREALQRICARYNVPFDEGDYITYGPNEWMMPGYAVGWVGGRFCVGNTIYVGCDPEGRISS